MAEVHAHYRITSATQTIDLPVGLDETPSHQYDAHVHAYIIKGASVTAGVPDDPFFYVEMDQSNSSARDIWRKQIASGVHIGTPLLLTGIYTAENLGRPIHLGVTHDKERSAKFTITATSGTPTFSEIDLWVVYRPK